MADGYTPTTQGGAAPAGNSFAGATGDFNVVSGVGQWSTAGQVPTRLPKTTPASDMLRSLVGLSSSELLAVQQRLVEAGYLSKSALSGVADADTRKAYAELLTDTSTYNNAGQYLTPHELLDRRITSRSAAGAATSADQQQYETALHTLSPTDPARIRLTAEAAFKEALGRKPKPAEMAKFVASYTAQETHAQQVGFDAQDEVRGANIQRQLAGAGAATAAPAASGDDFAHSSQLQALIAAAPGKVTVASGTRSRAEQQKLYDDYVAGRGNLAAKPGHSKHETGEAADLHFADAKTRAWVHAHAAEFGIHFPVKGEAWHAEPIAARGSVGAPAAPGAAPLSQTITVTQPDAGAQAVEFARAQNPAETQAYGIGQQFDNFVQILKQGVI